jgi:DtxR family Mn-dependent transcriptional regulator
MTATTLSGALQDYLRAIYCLEKEAAGASSSLLAGRLGVSQPSVTSMVKKLAARKLIEHTPYLSITLTAAGERLALETVRHHRLIETYLQRALGLGLEELHEEAERLEHAMSEKLEDRIDAFLGHPAFDPHGSPIPDREGQVSQRDLVPLSQLRPGEKALVAQITCRAPKQLKHLEALGLVPGAAVRVKAADLGGGVMRLEFAAHPDEPVGESISGCVFVSRIGGKK